MRPPLAVASVSLALGLVACSSPAPTYEVSGVALARPGCAVERPGEQCPPLPVVAPIVFVSGDNEVARATSGSDGRFVVSLPSGSYSVRVLTPDGSPPTCPTTPLTVASAPTTLAIDCDSGIR